MDAYVGAGGRPVLGDQRGYRLFQVDLAAGRSARNQ